MYCKLHAHCLTILHGLLPFNLWLPWLGLPKLCWIKLTTVDILVLFLILEEMLSAFLIWEWCLLWGSHIWPLLYWGMFSLYAHFLESFCHKWVLNFIKSFFCIYWDGCMIFTLQWLMWCITLIDLQILRNLWISDINPTWWSCAVL